jgi:23S rRNA (cytosine1962-C5)-methyltransferase
VNGAGYRFLDCGRGRRLEEFGGVAVVRPAPAAAFAPGLDEAAWRGAQVSYTRERGWEGETPGEWVVDMGGGARMALRPAAGGQVGAFPEHGAVAENIARRAGELSAGRAFSALNLFAHTGLLTLRLAGLSKTGFDIDVAHVDAARAAVRAARENAALSGLETARIRWLVDDAIAFTRREARRGKRYFLIAADPPSFGRAEKGGREWKFDRDIGAFLDDAARLFGEGPGLFCLTCHSGGWSPDRLADAARGAFPERDGWAIEADGLVLRSAVGGRDLPAGAAAYVWRT